MRFALALAVLVTAAGVASADDLSKYKLRTNQIGCRNPQDLIDFVRMGKQAHGDQQLLGFVLQGLFSNISAGACHQYTQGTPVIIAKRQMIQDVDLECIRDEQQEVCFYALTPTS